MEPTPFVFVDPMLWYSYQQMLPPHPYLLASSLGVNAPAELPCPTKFVCSVSETGESPPLKREPKM